MATATKSGQSLSFTYNADGLRTTKTVNGVVHTYYYSGSKLVRETYGDYVLDFFYDQNGTPFMLLQNGNIYYYITNAQGDVIRLVDINGNIAASYRYDPYGKAISALGSHANINPLRYRGYVYDHETGLYYLQSRYYDPEIGRFLNADAFASTGQGLLGNNMFTYCLNNPVIYADNLGFAPCHIMTCLVDGGGWNDTNNFLEDTFGAAWVHASSYDTMTFDTFFGGEETGFSSSAIVAGDMNKPISVYFQSASKWWKITEYKIGVQLKIGDSGVRYAKNKLETSVTIYNGEKSHEVIFGVDKIGYTRSSEVDFGNFSAGGYYHCYVRSSNIIGTAVATVAVVTAVFSAVGSASGAVAAMFL